MKTKKLVVSGMLVGAFVFGAMFAPLGKSTAEGNGQQLGNLNPPAGQQAANGVEIGQQENVGFICPATGEPAIGRGGGSGRHAGMGSYPGLGQDYAGSMHDAIAAELEMTAEELYEARYEGKSIADLAAEKGIAVEELVAAVVEVRKAELQPLVETGELSEAQFQAILTNLETRLTTIGDQAEIGPGNRRGAGPMGMRQGGRMYGKPGNL